MRNPCSYIADRFFMTFVQKEIQLREKGQFCSRVLTAMKGYSDDNDLISVT